VPALRGLCVSTYLSGAESLGSPPVKYEVALSQSYYSREYNREQYG
jgi:hypothetical protein